MAETDTRATLAGAKPRALRFGVRFESIGLVGVLGFLSACTVDGSVIDDLPCECAANYICVENRCVRVTPDGGGDAGPDGSGRDPALGDCLAGDPDTFDAIDEERWDHVDDGVGELSAMDGAFVTRVPADNVSAFSFLFARERVDLNSCAILIEMPLAQAGDGAVSFFSARITNQEGSIGFGVRSDEIRATYYDGSETMMVWAEPYDAAQHRWFALRGTDGDLLWLVSADGRDWREVARVSAPIALDALQPLFGIGADRDNPDIEARFDNYNNPI